MELSIYKNRGQFYLTKNLRKQFRHKIEINIDVKNQKRLIIKVVEYVMKKEKFTYYNVYKIKDVIKRIRFTSSESDVYKFVKSLGGN